MTRDFGPIASSSGFLVLALFTALLYVGSTVVGAGERSTGFLILGVWTLGLLYAFPGEWSRSISSAETAHRYNFSGELPVFVAVVLGAVITFWMSVDLGLGAVIASSLVGIAASLWRKELGAPAFCGSFAGMASAEVFGHPQMLLAGAICATLFVASKHVFKGFGGKLGTIAWAGTVATAVISRRPLPGEAVYMWSIGAPLIVYATVGAVLTFVLSHRYKAGPVLASGVIGLLAGLLLPLAHGAETGGLYAVSAFCGSFAGMSGLERFKHAGWMVPAGAVCGLILMYSAPFIGGAGGKLGTAAFGAVIGVHGLTQIVAITLRRSLFSIFR